MSNEFIKKIKDFKEDLTNNRAHCLSFLLNEEPSKALSLKGIKIRKIFSPLLRFIYGFQSEYKFVMDSKEPLDKSKKNHIFIVNHRQGDDMVLSAKAIGQSGYFVFGNKILALESFSNGYGLWAHGMILLDRENKQNRKFCYDKMKYIIENGGNIIIFPEGYWNLSDNGQKDSKHGADSHNSENWLIQDINIGAIRLAKETGCDIIPTILHYDEINKKICYAKRGQSISISKDDDIIKKKDEIMEYMHTMYYSLMEKYSSYNRQDIEKNGMSLREQWEQLKKKLISFCTIDSVGYKLDLQDEKRIGKAPVVNQIITNEDAYEHLEKIDYNSKNAFLLSKKLTGKNMK